MALVLGGSFWELENEDTNAVYFESDFATSDERVARGYELVKMVEAEGATLLTDATLWIGGVGVAGIDAVAEILVGKVNPSGSLVDTYCNDVAFPFGYGLSYTNFEYSNMSMTYDVETTTYTVKVTVTNTGNVAGKETVQIYVSSPYTEYDIENKVEKASVSLVGFDKTQILEPGASEELTIYVDGDYVASYDAYGAGTYIMDAGVAITNQLSDSDIILNDAVIVSAMREACHQNLYAIANSNGMNGIGENTTIKAIEPTIVTVCKVITAIFSIIFLVSLILWIKKAKEFKKSEAYVNYKNMLN